MTAEHTHPCVTHCGRPAEGAYLCRWCAEDLATRLGAVAELAAELEIQRARLARLGDQVLIQTSGPAPLPYDPGAAEAAEVLANTITTWAADAADHCGQTLEAENPAEAALWLRARVNALRTHPAAAELAEEIRHATEYGWRAVDRPPGKVFLGTCSAETEAGPCPADLYTRADAAGRPRAGITSCPVCAAQWDTERRRAWLLDSLRGQLATAREIASAAGVIAGREINVKTIRTWHHNGRIPALGHAPDGCPLHRIGDVVDVAAVTATRRRANPGHVAPA